MKAKALDSLAALLRKMPWIMVIAYAVIRWWQPKFTVGVAGVIFNAEGQVLLVKHVFHPKVPWGLPGGWIDPNEEPHLAISREIMEELKLEVKRTELLLVELNDSHYRHLDIAYLCESDNEIGSLSKELLDYGWFPPEQVPRIAKFHFQAIQKAVKLKQPGKTI